mmetsp:Transcript_13802/g.50265  ORF Transcript_13802/g.50265 Transcript_13802/m.50265 type:complete len:129 (+) Transcript_13802:1486-1872(+)
MGPQHKSRGVGECIAVPGVGSVSAAPDCHPADSVQVSWLRQRKQEDRLSGAQIRSVESVGFEWELSEASGKRRPRAYGNGSGRKEDGHKAVETVRRGASASTREKPGKNGGARNSSADPSSVIAQEML